jgi:hypothetical protein
VVLQRRLVNLGGEGDFVLGIGLRRIEVLGAIREGRVENVATGIGGRVGIIPGLTAGSQEQNGQQENIVRMG